MFAGAAASPGAALLQTLRLNCPFNLIGRKPRLEKQVRASTQTACFESGRVLLPHEAPWVADYGRGAPRLPISKVRRPRRQHEILLEYAQEKAAYEPVICPCINKYYRPAWLVGL